MWGSGDVPASQNFVHTQGQLLTLVGGVGQKKDQDPLLGRLSSKSSWLPHCLMPFVAALCMEGLSRALVLWLWELLQLCAALERVKSSHQALL